eukprot:jgi/Psemu1/16037/gm1.16037_g
MDAEAKQSVQDSVEQLLVTTQQIVEGSNKKNHRNIPGMLRDEYALKKDAYPTTPSETLELLVRFKTRDNNKTNGEKTVESTAFVTNEEVYQNNVQEAHQLLMDAHVSHEMEYLLAQNNRRLNPDLLLLDSQATCNVISNRKLLKDI